mgnify:FL=1|tara:strand:- start:840 stop:1142 length:303 start_codon:yes stop_codon:yes gene_type:complete
MSYKYKISKKFCWFRDGSMIVAMYFINEKPFTFDELPDGHLEDEDLLREADKNASFDDEDMYNNFFYLIEEELHPCFFAIDLENPEELPDDLNYAIYGED